MATYQVLYWHDIPVQVRAGGRRDRVSQELPPRFQEAVDQAAMAARVTGTDAYLDGFHWSEPAEEPGTPQEVVAAVVARLEAAQPRVSWRQTAIRLNPNAGSAR